MIRNCHYLGLISATRLIPNVEMACQKQSIQVKLKKLINYILECCLLRVNQIYKPPCNSKIQYQKYLFVNLLSKFSLFSLNSVLKIKFFFCKSLYHLETKDPQIC